MSLRRPTRRSRLGLSFIKIRFHVSITLAMFQGSVWDTEHSGCQETLQPVRGCGPGRPGNRKREDAGTPRR